MALIVGARTFDRLFAGIRFDEADGHLLYAYAKDEETASEIEDKFALHISIIASKILGQQIRSPSYCRKFFSNPATGPQSRSPSTFKTTNRASLSSSARQRQACLKNTPNSPERLDYIDA